MKKPLRILVVLGLAITLARAATPLYICPDVPTTESATSSTLLPSQFVKYVSSPVGYTLVLTIPGNPTLDAIDRLDKPNNWLFSVESANSLGGALGGPDADPRDVIRLDTGTGTSSVFFCGSAVGVPDYANVDAAYLDGGDTGDLIVSFNAPTAMGAFTFYPADLVRFVHTGAGCAGWTLAATNPDFNATATGVPTASDVVAAARVGSLRILSFDVPTTLGATTYLPGEIVSWNGAAFALWKSLSGWPTSGEATCLSWEGNPGRVPPTIHVDKAGANITVNWSTSCSQGADDYEIYEGTIGSWYSHTSKVCADTGHDLTETFTPAVGSDYYLVVPRNDAEEGSYGTNSGGVERPVGTATCVTPQVLTSCPP